MAGKKSPNGSRSDSEGTLESPRAPMREFSRSLPMSLLRAREAVMRQFRPSLRNHGLTEQQWRILRALTTVDTIEVSELAGVAVLVGPSLAGILRDRAGRHLVVLLPARCITAAQMIAIICLMVDTRAIFRSKCRPSRSSKPVWEFQGLPLISPAFPVQGQG